MTLTGPIYSNMGPGSCGMIHQTWSDDLFFHISGVQNHVFPIAAQGAGDDTTTVAVRFSFSKRAISPKKCTLDEERGSTPPSPADKIHERNQSPTQTNQAQDARITCRQGAEPVLLLAERVATSADKAKRSKAGPMVLKML